MNRDHVPRWIREVPYDVLFDDVELAAHARANGHLPPLPHDVEGERTYRAYLRAHGLMPVGVTP